MSSKNYLPFDGFLALCVYLQVNETNNLFIACVYNQFIKYLMC